MITSHELFAFMSPDLAKEILNYALNSDKVLYRAISNEVAQTRKLRPVFFERKPRQDRDRDILATLARPSMEATASNLLRTWLLKAEKPMLVDFLNTIGIPNKEGVVEDLPEKLEDGKLEEAIQIVLGKYPKEKVIVYLHTFYLMNEPHWVNLEERLNKDERLQLG